MAGGENLGGPILSSPSKFEMWVEEHPWLMYIVCTLIVGGIFYILP